MNNIFWIIYGTSILVLLHPKGKPWRQADQTAKRGSRLPAYNKKVGMKELVKILLVCGFASAPVATSAFAHSLVVTIDENGNGAVTGLAAQPVPVAPSIQTDPISGQAGLFYDFGPIIAATHISIAVGDVVITDGFGDSDLLRFVSATGLQGIFFFSASDPDDTVQFYPYYPGPALADVDSLPASAPGFFSVPEVNGTGAWHPTAAGQPGFVPEAPSLLDYTFISDEILIPEPRTLALFGLAGGVLALFWRQRSGRA